jgi:hypothetical protein
MGKDRENCLFDSENTQFGESSQHSAENAPTAGSPVIAEWRSQISFS